MQQSFGKWTAIAALMTCQGLAVAATDYYGKGYTIISGSDETSDLDAVVYRNLPAGDVNSALLVLLDGTGWRLADSYASDPRIFRLYLQPLAENKKSIGPMRLDRALKWIAGDAWELVVDPVNRLVSFEVGSRYETIIKPAPAAAPVASSAYVEPIPASAVTPVAASTPIEQPATAPLPQTVVTRETHTETYPKSFAPPINSPSADPLLAAMTATTVTETPGYRFDNFLANTRAEVNQSVKRKSKSRIDAQQSKKGGKK